MAENTCDRCQQLLAQNTNQSTTMRMLRHENEGVTRLARLAVGMLTAEQFANLRGLDLPLHVVDQVAIKAIDPRGER